MAREDYYAQQEMVQNSRALLDAFTIIQGAPNPEAYNLRPVEAEAGAEPASPSSPPLSPSEPPVPAPAPVSASTESETDLLNSVMSTGLAPTTVNPLPSEEVTALTTSLSSVGVEGTSLEVWQGAINKLRPERSKALSERVEALQKGTYHLDTPFGYKTVLGELGLISDPEALIETTGPVEVIGGAAGAGWRIGGKGLAALSAAAGVLEAPLLPYVDEVTEGNFLLGTALGILTGVGTGVAVEAGIPAFGRALSRRVDKYILDDADILGYDTLKVHKLQKYKLTKAIKAGDLSSPETRRIVSDVIADVKKNPSVTLSKEESAALTIVENKLSEPNTKLTGDRPSDELVSESWEAASPEVRKRTLQEEAIVRRVTMAEWYGPPQYPKRSNRFKELKRISKHIARENPSWSASQIRAKANTLMNERIQKGYYSANWLNDYSAALRQAEANGVELTVQARKDIAESLTAEYNKGIQADIDRILADKNYLIVPRSSFRQVSVEAENPPLNALDRETRFYEESSLTQEQKLVTSNAADTSQEVRKLSDAIDARIKDIKKSVGLPAVFTEGLATRIQGSIQEALANDNPGRAKSLMAHAKDLDNRLAKVKSLSEKLESLDAADPAFERISSQHEAAIQAVAKKQDFFLKQFGESPDWSYRFDARIKELETDSLSDTQVSRSVEDIQKEITWHEEQIAAIEKLEQGMIERGARLAPNADKAKLYAPLQVLQEELQAAKQVKPAQSNKAIESLTRKRQEIIDLQNERDALLPKKQLAVAPYTPPIVEVPESVFLIRAQRDTIPSQREKVPKSRLFKYSTYATEGEAKAGLKNFISFWLDITKPRVQAQLKRIKIQDRIYSPAKRRFISMPVLPAKEVDAVATLLGWDPKKHLSSVHTKDTEVPSISYYLDPDDIAYWHEQALMEDAMYPARFSKNELTTPNWKEAESLKPREIRSKRRQKLSINNSAYTKQQREYLEKLFTKLYGKSEITQAEYYAMLDRFAVMRRQLVTDLQSIDPKSPDYEQARLQLLRFSDHFTGNRSYELHSAMSEAQVRELAWREAKDFRREYGRSFRDENELSEMMDELDLTEEEALDFLARKQTVEAELGDELESVASVADSEEGFARPISEDAWNSDVAGAPMRTGELNKLFTDDPDIESPFVPSDSRMGPESEIPEAYTIAYRAKQLEDKMGHRVAEELYAPGINSAFGKTNILRVNSATEYDLLKKHPSIQAIVSDLPDVDPQELFNILPPKTMSAEHAKTLSYLLQDHIFQLDAVAQKLVQHPEDSIAALAFEKMKALTSAIATELATGAPSPNAMRMIAKLSTEAVSDKSFVANTVAALKAYYPIADDVPDVTFSTIQAQMLNDIPTMAGRANFLSRLIDTEEAIVMSRLGPQLSDAYKTVKRTLDIVCP